MISKKTARNLSSGICEAVAEKPSGFGKRMLEKFGWEEGNGLGANQQGMKKSVRVTKKDDSKGLGAREAEIEAEKAGNMHGDWWNDAFRKVAAALPEKIVNRPRSDSESSSSSPSSNSPSSSSGESDAESDNGVDLSRLSEADRQLFLMCGKRRLGRRANRAQKGKWKREAQADKEFLEKFVNGKQASKDGSESEQNEQLGRSREEGKEKKKRKEKVQAEADGGAPENKKQKKKFTEIEDENDQHQSKKKTQKTVDHRNIEHDDDHLTKQKKEAKKAKKKSGDSDRPSEDLTENQKTKHKKKRQENGSQDTKKRSKNAVSSDSD